MCKQKQKHKTFKATKNPICQLLLPVGAIKKVIYNFKFAFCKLTKMIIALVKKTL